MFNSIDLFFDTVLASPALQGLTGTASFFHWFFYGMGGLGGWFIFFLIALAATIWLLYDSGRRRLPATGWKIGVILLLLLMLPTILYKFTVKPVDFEVYDAVKGACNNQEVCPVDYLTVNYPDVGTDCKQICDELPPLTPFGEWIFYLGLLGSVLAPVLLIGYFVTYQGLVGCPQGHVYEASLGQCPECNRLRQPIIVPAAAPAPVYQPPTAAPQPVAPLSPRKPKVNNAWLVDTTNNRRYDLCQGITRIGRSSDNDLVLADPAVSRSHAQIREASGHFTISDLGAKSGTYLNGTRLRNPQILQNGDEITMGDTVLRFISAT